MSVALSKSPPKYRHFKPRNLAVVRIQGRDHYLGEYNSPESWEKYHRILAEFHSRPTTVAPDEKSGFIGISVIAEAYLNFAKTYYAKNDPKGTEYRAIQYALKPLCELYGLTDASQFGPKSLKLVRERMVALGWCRRLVNVRINLIKRCFKWAVAEELVSANVLLGL